MILHTKGGIVEWNVAATPLSIIKRPVAMSSPTRLFERECTCQNLSVDTKNNLTNKATTKATFYPDAIQNSTQRNPNTLPCQRKEFLQTGKFVKYPAPTIVRIQISTGTNPVWGIASGRERARIVTSGVLREKRGMK